MILESCIIKFEYFFYLLALNVDLYKAWSLKILVTFETGSRWNKNIDSVDTDNITEGRINMDTTTDDPKSMLLPSYFKGNIEN